MDNDKLLEKLIIFDIRGIQNYIYRSKKLKEVSGASCIVEKLLKDTIIEYCQKNCIDLQMWCDNTSFFDFKFFNKENLNKQYIEFVYEGGGNLLLATRLNEEMFDEFCKHIQLTFLKKTYSLSIAFAIEEINENTDYINNAYGAIKEKLKEVKKKMPLLSLAKPLPICEIDSTTGYALGKDRKDQPNNNHYSYESYYKLDNYKDSKNKELDKFFEEDEIDDDSIKTMIAVVHIDGNDMGGTISSYMVNKKKDKMSFAEGVRISRELSYKINKVFKYEVEKILNNFVARTVINSGDDITFICKAQDALNITKAIMEMIENNYLGDNKNNIFTSCAGISFTHRHFPFHIAYEIAEECCSLAKKKAKIERNKYTLNINGKSIKRAASYIDFEIVKAGIIKSVSSKREVNKNLYLRPYLVKVNHDNIEFNNEDVTIDELISTVNKLSKDDVSRNAVKEIRNTYESSQVETEILFLRLKSRNNMGKQFDYEPYNQNEIAKYYDAATLIDIILKGGHDNEC